VSNSSDNTGCISHRRQTRFFVMYEDFLDVAKVSEHQYKLAAFWRVLETKTNDRLTFISDIVEDCKNKGIPVPEKHLWIEIPYSEFVKRALGVYKVSSFQIASAESEHLGFSKSRVLKRPANPNDPDSSKEDYKEYLFCTDAMQMVLNTGVYPTPVEINSPLLKKRAVKNNTTPPVKNNNPPAQDPLLKTTGRGVENNNNKYKKESSFKNDRDKNNVSSLSSKRSFPQPNQPRSSYDDPNFEDDSFYPTREVK
jgi:hypothetical protein